MESFGRIEKLCPHIHLPVQSGSNRLLERMNRRYTREHYLDIISKLRDTCPEIAVTTDMIVGFPGETRADFEATLDLMRHVHFDSLFAFMYSDRPKAPSILLPEKVPAPESANGSTRCFSFRTASHVQKNAALVGSIQEVMAEGLSKRPSSAAHDASSPAQWTGRTPGNKIVNFHTGIGSGDVGNILPGRLVPVRIEAGFAHSLRGVRVGAPATGPAGKRGRSCCVRSTSPV